MGPKHGPGRRGQTADRRRSSLCSHTTMKEISFEIPDRDDRGVSPVIGVILMVAITVILAAVIASFVLGFGDSVSENVQAGADVSQTNDGNATATWISEGNAETLNVSVSNNDTTVELDGDAVTAKDLDSVGENVRITADSEDEILLTVTATGSGGSQTVVTQEEITVGAES